VGTEAWPRTRSRTSTQSLARIQTERTKFFSLKKKKTFRIFFKQFSTSQTSLKFFSLLKKKKVFLSFSIRKKKFGILLLSHFKATQTLDIFRLKKISKPIGKTFRTK